MSILDKLEKKQILLSDGAWGTFLQATGLKPGECPELWNVTRRHDVLSIAEAYIEAGSDIIETNSFGGNIFKLSQYGLGDRVFELNKAAAAISRQAAGVLKHVAGSVGPTGKMLIMGDVTEEELYNGFKEQATGLEAGGADIIIIETMSAIDEASIAVRAARENTKCIVIATMTFEGSPDGEYRTMMGVSPSEMVTAMIEAGAHIVGSNCGNGIENMIGIVREIRLTDRHIPVMIQANAGVPELIEWKTVFRESPVMMASYVPALIEAGANIIGGCCGTTPAHIYAMSQIIRK
ncbi:MAG: methionine synthase [Bacteroidetes bacterium GWE2_41_25]|nr:MAG: methionine synthase [Bacteroidetes bacterium GWA2_40_15]OFX84466.1 MAG: methionine synthase [Bacteroidetes bacterium GWC2_40_22]OFY03641.1 MAG: methionine synthase [Bacteroidetes bacterium GWE2_41_25]HAM10050.1 methionine synthase [Bacteroidales bacterium]HBH85859.1 methionine synthase [Bacteroidales bacterium]